MVFLSDLALALRPPHCTALAFVAVQVGQVCDLIRKRHFVGDACSMTPSRGKPVTLQTRPTFSFFGVKPFHEYSMVKKLCKKQSLKMMGLHA